jgi:hypothetical protein
MARADRVFPPTWVQLDIWPAQEKGGFSAKWQMGVLVRIEGTTKTGMHNWAIRQVVREAETLKASFLEVHGQFFPKLVNYPDAELAYDKFVRSQDRAQETNRLASSIQRTPEPLSGALLKFALFQTGVDQFHLFVCWHHRVVYGIRFALPSISPAFVASLSDLIDCESEYEGSTDYLDDQAYCSRNLPTKSEPGYRLANAVEGRNLAQPSSSALLDPFGVAGIDELSQAWGPRRASMITAACALLARGYGVEYSEVALDFSVSRHVCPDTQTMPGMISRVVPPVLKSSRGSAVAGFCEHADTSMREALRISGSRCDLLRTQGFRVECDTDVIDAAGIEALIGRFKRVLVARTADSGGSHDR